MIECPKCKSQNPEGAIYCAECGAKIGNEVTTEESNNKGSILAIISLLLFYIAPGFIITILETLPPQVGDRLSFLAAFCPLSAIVIMIVGRINYPQNKLLRVAMWIIISTIALGLINIILLYVYCISRCN